MISEWIKHQVAKKQVNEILRSKRCEKHTDRRQKLKAKALKRDNRNEY